jgi:hypothetical protein
MHLLATGGFELDLTDATRLVAVLDFLAEAHPQAADGFAAAHRRARRLARGPLVAVTGNAGAAELAALGGLHSRTGLVMVAQVGGASVTVPGAVTVPLPVEGPFAPSWNQAVVACENTAALR